MFKNLHFRFTLALFLCLLLLVQGTFPSWASPGRESAGPALQRAIDYLLQREKAKGGLLPWSYIALAAAGKELKDTQAVEAVEKVSAMAEQSGEMNDYAALVLAVLAAGGNPYDFQGQNLVKRIQNAQLAGGKFADHFVDGGERLINAHVWSILALYAAGGIIPDKGKALDWLAAQQHPDGSFNWDAENKETPDVDSTGMVLMALGSLGVPKDSPVVQKAVAYLQKAQKKHGGFESWGTENPESCHMVIAGLKAVGLDPLGEAWQKSRGNPLSAMLRFQLPDGSFEHTAGAGSNEMSTYQALMALTSVYHGQTFFERLRTKSEPVLSPAGTEVSGHEVRFVVGDPHYTVVTRGQRREERGDAAPFIADDRTYVPVRFLASALGAGDQDIVWDKNSQRIQIAMGGTKVELVIGMDIGYINGQTRAIGVVPQIRNGRTYLPARFVAEAFGFRVGWNPTSQTVSISR